MHSYRAGWRLWNQYSVCFHGCAVGAKALCRLPRCSCLSAAIVRRAQFPTGTACSRSRYTFTSNFLPFRQDAQPQDPWRHNVEGAVIHVHVTDAYPISGSRGWRGRDRRILPVSGYVRPASLSYDGGLGLRYWISAANFPNYVTLMIFCICTVRELAGTKLGTAERIGMQGRYATPERPD